MAARISPAGASLTTWTCSNPPIAGSSRTCGKYQASACTEGSGRNAGVVVVGGGKDKGVAPHHRDTLLLHSRRTRASSGPIPPSISITSSAPSKLSRTLRFAERSAQA